MIRFSWFSLPLGLCLCAFRDLGSIWESTLYRRSVLNIKCNKITAQEQVLCVPCHYGIQLQRPHRPRIWSFSCVFSSFPLDWLSLCAFSSLYNVPDSRYGVPSLFWLTSFWQHLPQSHIKSSMRPFPAMGWEAEKLMHWNRPSVCVGGKQKAKRWAIPWFWHISGQCWV